jgi:hypothetical protein
MALGLYKKDGIGVICMRLHGQNKLYMRMVYVHWLERLEVYPTSLRYENIGYLIALIKIMS